MIKPGLVRFILASVVILFHITRYMFLGHFAVLCFFMLSGYWITYMYDGRYREERRAWLPFYLGRIWRLLPVYLLLNGLAFLAYFHYNPGLEGYLAGISGGQRVLFWLANVFILGFSLLPQQVLSPAWSLDIELQFYLLFPLLFYGLSRLAPRHYGVAWAVLLALVVGVAAVPTEWLVAKTIAVYLPYFLIGSFVYLGRMQFSYRTELVCNVVLLLVLAAHYLVPTWRDATVNHHLSLHNELLNSFLPLLLLPLLSNSVHGGRGSRLDTTLGNLSYVMYLTHWVVIIPYQYYMAGQPGLVKAEYTAIYLAVTVALSYAIYRLYDQPIERLRRRWSAA